MKSQDYPIKHFEEMVSLAKALSVIPAQIDEHNYNYECMGSWVCKIKVKGKIFRICFDGRDNQTYLDKFENDSWESIIYDKTKSLKHIITKLKEIKNV